jgi:hypothetical protein
VQIRQDFSKNLINVLQTGSLNLTLARPSPRWSQIAIRERRQFAVEALKCRLPHLGGIFRSPAANGP